MHHPTSTWAIRYGLRDPGPAASDLLGLSPAELARRFRTVGELADRIDRSCDSLRASRATLRLAWTTGAAAAAADTLLAAAESGAGVLRAGAAAAIRTADALESTRAAVLAGYAAADASIARDDLLRPDVAEGWGAVLDPATAVTDAALRAGRITVVSELDARIERAGALATAALRTLRDALDVDPREGLRALRGPDGRPPGSRPDPSMRDDQHNRAALAADLAGNDPVRAAFAAGVARALDRAAGTEPPGTVVQLLVYDPMHPAGQGGAAIAIGDVSAADDVAVVVPGVANSPSSMRGALDAAAQLRSEAEAADPTAAVAAVAWLDYDLPLSWPHDLPSTPATPTAALLDSLTVLDGTDAVAGGARLADFTQQLRAEMEPSARLTLVGHSYGSVVVSQAALRSDGIDDVVLLAAPGAGPGVRDTADYRTIGGDHVFALSFDDDPVTRPITDLITAALVPLTARPPGPPFGPDPASAGFGAVVIDAPSAVPAVRLGTTAALPGGLPQAAVIDALTPLAQHPLSNYLSGAAGAAVGAVVVGRYASVRIKRGR